SCRFHASFCCASACRRQSQVLHRNSQDSRSCASQARNAKGMRDPLSGGSERIARVSQPANVVALPHGRVPPHNLDAERSLLGGILLDSQAFNDIVEIVRAEEFYRDAHRKVFEAMSALAA